MTQETNQEVYEQSDVVKNYGHHTQLTKGEQALLRRFPADWSNAPVLDLGVGAGRTTPYLAASAQEYWGIDYSKAMVDACKLKFKSLKNARFVQDDARSLDSCPDSYFDTVIFSFNGIDVVDFEGRIKVLEAVRRVLKPDGIFIFSFHNAGTLESLYRYHWRKNPFLWWGNLRRMQQIQRLNGPSDQYKDREYFTLKDGGEDFRLDIFYARPSFQSRQLNEYQFELKQAFESESGKELSLNALDQSESSWIYYRCKKK